MARDQQPAVAGPATTTQDRPTVDPDAVGPLPRYGRTSVLLLAVLFLLTTGRWGSHVGVPGLPFYIGDVALAAALVQVVQLLARSRTSAGDVGRAVARAPLALLLAAALLAWALLRALIGLPGVLSDPLSALRDLAPYAYAVAALVAFLVPTLPDERARRWVFGALSVHAAWVLASAVVPGWPWVTVSLGEAVVLVPRPDFDAAVCGAATALAVHTGLQRPGGRNRWWWLRLATFAAVNAYAATLMLTRAGLLAMLLALVAVGATWALRGLDTRALVGRRGGALLLAAAALLGLAAVSPPGQRLLETVGGGTNASQGTVHARQVTWSGVDEYITSAARRTAVGVGFGPDFLSDSGTVTALEGDDYENVRSPHNYLVGTFARLGVFGALLAATLLAAAAALGLRALAGATGTVDQLAALLVLVLPVTALLGVVLESPFGAIPYFWAVGQLARWAYDRDASAADRLSDRVRSPRTRGTSGTSARSRP